MSRASGARRDHLREDCETVESSTNLSARRVHHDGSPTKTGESFGRGKILAVTRVSSAEQGSF